MVFVIVLLIVEIGNAAYPYITESSGSANRSVTLTVQENSTVERDIQLPIANKICDTCFLSKACISRANETEVKWACSGITCNFSARCHNPNSVCNVKCTIDLVINDPFTPQNLTWQWGDIEDEKWSVWGSTQSINLTVYDTPCFSHQAPYNEYQPCGFSLCYQQINNGVLQDTCFTSCNSTNHTTESEGKCVLKSCTLRTVNNSASYPCGSADCYQQIKNEVEQTTCHTSCPSTNHTTDSGGKCVLKSCTLRTVNNSASYPCGSGNCYLQINNGVQQTTCGTSCPSSNHTKISDAKCVLKSCTLRSVNNSASYPCGSAGCYLLPNAKDGLCVEKCPIDHEIDGVNCSLKQQENNNGPSRSSQSKKPFNLAWLGLIIPLALLVVAVISAIVVIMVRSKGKEKTILFESADSKGEGGSLDRSANVLLEENQEAGSVLQPSAMGQED